MCVCVCVCVCVCAVACGKGQGCLILTVLDCVPSIYREQVFLLVTSVTLHVGDLI